MYQLRRLSLLFVVLVVGMILTIVSKALIFIIGIPLLMLLIMQWDEITYKKQLIKMKRGN